MPAHRKFNIVVCVMYGIVGLHSINVTPDFIVATIERMAGARESNRDSKNDSIRLCTYTYHLHGFPFPLHYAIGINVNIHNC